MCAQHDLEVLATARALAVDGFAAEMVRGLRQNGIEPILLKGASLAGWLYPDAVRPYGDADLLVAPGQVMAAADVLTGLGLRPVDGHVSLHAHPWVRESDGAVIDLHSRLYGPRAPAESCWRVLQNWTEDAEIAGVSVRVLNPAGRVVHVCMHAVQHADDDKPREDLRRALERAPLAVWQGAQELADRLRALPILAAALALEPAGRRLIADLPLVRAAQVVDEAGAPLAIGLARLRAADGLRAKLAVVAVALAAPRSEGSRSRHLLSLGARLVRTVWALRGRRRGQSVRSRP